jgi:hypothetical protein
MDFTPSCSDGAGKRYGRVRIKPTKLRVYRTNVENGRTAIRALLVTYVSRTLTYIHRGQNTKRQNTRQRRENGVGFPLSRIDGSQQLTQAAYHVADIGLHDRRV